MGIGSSKERSRHNASINYAGWGSDALDDVPSILGGSVHSLCAGEQSILVTGGEDQVTGGGERQLTHFDQRHLSVTLFSSSLTQIRVHRPFEYIVPRPLAFTIVANGNRVIFVRSWSCTIGQSTSCALGSAAPKNASPR